MRRRRHVPVLRVAGDDLHDRVCRREHHRTDVPHARGHGARRVILRRRVAGDHQQRTAHQQNTTHRLPPQEPAHGDRAGHHRDRRTHRLALRHRLSRARPHVAPFGPQLADHQAPRAEHMIRDVQPIVVQLVRDERRIAVGQLIQRRCFLCPRPQIGKPAVMPQRLNEKRLCRASNR